MRVDLPPLRERPGDVRLLIDHFVGLHRVTEEAIGGIEAYHWPRNVRELHGVLTSGAALAGSEMLGLEHIRDRLRAKPAASNTGVRTNGVIRTLDEVEREHTENVIAHTRGNKSEAARIRRLIGRRSGRSCKRSGRTEGRVTQGEEDLTKWDPRGMPKPKAISDFG
jgi:DNA-binding NtrC family response regulator